MFMFTRITVSPSVLWNIYERPLAMWRFAFECDTVERHYGGLRSGGSPTLVSSQILQFFLLIGKKEKKKRGNEWVLNIQCSVINDTIIEKKINRFWENGHHFKLSRGTHTVGDWEKKIIISRW